MKVGLNIATFGCRRPNRVCDNRNELKGAIVDGEAKIVEPAE